MTSDEADEFVKWVDGAWTPPLTDPQRMLWRETGSDLDARTAFDVLSRLFKRAQRRPSAPDFLSLYHHARADATPLHTGPQDRDEMPDWVRGWRLARIEDDWRAWPEQEPGYERKEWREVVAKYGLMPQEARYEYTRRAKEEGVTWKPSAGF